MSTTPRAPLILVTGATGHVGERLVRDPARLLGRPWMPPVEVATGAILLPPTRSRALEGGETLSYLGHSLGGLLRAGAREAVALSRPRRPQPA